VGEEQEPMSGAEPAFRSQEKNEEHLLSAFCLLLTAYCVLIFPLRFDKGSSILL
jgi:hypothetical protein